MFGSMINSALAGGAATAPMTALMTAFFPLLPRRDKYALPPSQLTRKVEDAAEISQRTPRELHHRLTMLSHFAYGAAAGSFFPVLTRKITAGPSVKGACYGLFIWAASYLGWLPATGILKTEETQTLPRNLLMISAHLAWGVTLSWYLESLESPAAYRAFTHRHVNPPRSRAIRTADSLSTST